MRKYIDWFKSKLNNEELNKLKEMLETEKENNQELITSRKEITIKYLQSTEKIKKYQIELNKFKDKNKKTKDLNKKYNINLKEKKEQEKINKIYSKTLTRLIEENDKLKSLLLNSN